MQSNNLGSNKTGGLQKCFLTTWLYFCLGPLACGTYTLIKFWRYNKVTGEPTYGETTYGQTFAHFTRIIKQVEQVDCRLQGIELSLLGACNLVWAKVLGSIAAASGGSLDTPSPWHMTTHWGFMIWFVLILGQEGTMTRYGDNIVPANHLTKSLKSVLQGNIFAVPVLTNPVNLSIWRLREWSRSN